MKTHHSIRVIRQKTFYSRRPYLGTRSTSPDNPRQLQNGTGQYKNEKFNPVIHQILYQTQHI